jgi:exopolysaccharide production protein ExoQ
MPPAIASLVFTIGILGLLYLDRQSDARPSPFLWIPVAWMFIGASRMPTEWLNGTTSMNSPDQLLDGSPVDRLIVTGLLVAGLIVLATRGARVWELLKRNWPIVLFFVYCALSTLWSDYPLVAFKRWTKSLGNIAMVAIVLTDANPSAAVKRLFARTGFLLIAISVLFIKYYPVLGRGYDRWLGTAYYNGITTSKNLLGCDLLVFGLAALSRVARLVWDKVKWRQRGSLVAQAAILVMVVWLFSRVNSATSLACFLFGGTLIVLLTRVRNGRAATVHALVGGAVLAVAFGLLVLDGSTYVIKALGRDATLTGRTDLWVELLRLNKQPILGTGFESYFLGDRAEYLWDKYWWHPNEAHNGYLEVYLNLGLVGAGLMIFLLAWGYRNIVAAYKKDGELGALRVALLMSALLYNLTEAAFKVMNPMWIAFLLAIAVVPELEQRQDEKHAERAWVPAFSFRPLSTPKATVRPTPMLRRKPAPTTSHR